MFSPAVGPQGTEEGELTRQGVQCPPRAFVRTRCRGPPSSLGWTLRGGVALVASPFLDIKRLSFARKAMWHIEIQEGRLAGVREWARAQEEAAGRGLRVRAAQQFRREAAAWGKADRNRLLRVR